MSYSASDNDTRDERSPLYNSHCMESGHKSARATTTAVVDEASFAELTGGRAALLNAALADGAAAAPQYRVYKRRFLGLAQITLLNIVVSWNWLTFAPVSSTSAQYFHVSEGAINWLSTGFLFAFVVASPVAVWMLNRSIRDALLAASALMLVGSWIRYAGAGAGDEGSFGLVVFGQLVIGLAQPFVLSAPTRYSDMWFTEAGRISATAVSSLGNPFGGALGQLIDPLMAAEAGQTPDMVLYVAIITTVIVLPTILLPARPPLPPTPSAGVSSEVHLDLSVLRRLCRNPSFHLIFWPFAMYVSAFNATSTLLNQILEPYAFTETDAGIAGGLLIVAGLVAAALASPLLDRHKRARAPALKALVPVLALMYAVLVAAPGTRSRAALYVIAAVLGAASFSLVPLALELLVEFTWGEAGPELGSMFCWTGGQLGGALLILVMDALKGGRDAAPPGSMHRALVLQAVFAWLVVPLPLVLGYWGTGRSKRLEADRATEQDVYSP